LTFPFSLPFPSPFWSSEGSTCHFLFASHQAGSGNLPNALLFFPFSFSSFFFLSVAHYIYRFPLGSCADDGRGKGSQVFLPFFSPPFFPFFFPARPGMFPMKPLFLVEAARMKYPVSLKLLLPSLFFFFLFFLSGGRSSRPLFWHTARNGKGAAVIFSFPSFFFFLSPPSSGLLNFRF